MDQLTSNTLLTKVYFKTEKPPLTSVWTGSRVEARNLLERQSNGPITSHFLIQELFPDPYIFRKRKVDGHCFLMVSSIDCLVVLFSKGYFRSAIEEYSEGNHHLMKTTNLIKTVIQQVSGTS